MYAIPFVCIFKLILILFLLISFNSNVLEYLWHGFNYPDSLPARQSFLYIFLLISLGYEGFLSVRGMEADSFAISILSGLSLGILSAIFTHDDAVTASSLSLSAAFALAFVFILYLYRRSPSEKDFPGNIEKFVYRFIICSLLLTELCVNMYFTGSRSIPRSDYFSRYDDYKLLSDVVRTRNTNFKEPLSRTDEYSRNIRNHSMMLNFSSLSCFSSTTNGLITRYAERHGLMNSRVFYLSDGSTPIGKCFLGQHYSLLPANSLTSSEELLSPLKFSNGAVLYQHLYTLPNAYMLHNCDTALFTNVSKSSSIIDGSLTLSERWMEPADYENKLVNSMGSALTVFSPWENAYKTEDGFRVDFTKSAHLYAYNKNRTETDLIVRFSDGTENKLYNSQKNHYNLDLGYHKAGTYALITYLPAEDGKVPEKDFSLSVWALDQEALQAFTTLINRGEKLELSPLGDASVSGSIEAASGGMLVLSLPYEPGWELRVDGQEKEIYLFDGLLISCPLERGEHTVELSFTPPLFYEGLIISLMSTIMMAVSLRFHRHWALRDSFRRRFPKY